MAAWAAGKSPPSNVSRDLSREIKVGVLTVSDRCSAGTQEDKSGPNLKNLVQTHLHKLGIVKVIPGCVPDDIDTIKNSLIHWCDSERCNLILTCGGTGFSSRDVTPEATKSVIEKEAIGLTIHMITKSVQSTQMAMLSRPVCGIRGSTLIVNLPGSKKGSQECFEFIAPTLQHAFDLLTENVDKVRKTHSSMEKVCVHKESSSKSTSSRSSQESIGSIGSPSSREESPLPKYEPRASPVQKPIVPPSISCVALRDRKSRYPMIPVSKALSLILDSIEVKRKRLLVNLHAGLLGKVLMEDVRAKEPHPPFRASLKDGYACVAGDGMGSRIVVEPITAGNLPSREIKSGECSRITTGAPVPPGADCVVQVEDTELVEASPDGCVEMSVKIMNIPAVGQDIRKIGSDIKKGETVIAAGEKLGPAELGLIAMAGVCKVAVYDPPVIGIFSTGDELVSPDEEKQGAQIFDSNKITLLTACREQGFSAADLGILPDNYQQVSNKLQKVLDDGNHEVIITTGGVSMGEKDLLKTFLEEHGEVKFGRLLMKPGKPTTFATVQRGSKTTFFFALPGNPVSALVTFYLFVLPALKKLAGHKKVNLQRIQTRIGFDARLDPRPEYHRATLDWDTEDGIPIAKSTGSQCSSRLLSMRSCQALLELPSASTPRTIREGEIVTALLVPRIS